MRNWFTKVIVALAVVLAVGVPASAGTANAVPASATTAIAVSASAATATVDACDKCKYLWWAFSWICTDAQIVEGCVMIGEGCISGCPGCQGPCPETDETLQGADGAILSFAVSAEADNQVRLDCRGRLTGRALSREEVAQRRLETSRIVL